MGIVQGQPLASQPTLPGGIGIIGQPMLKCSVDIDPIRRVPNSPVVGRDSGHDLVRVVYARPALFVVRVGGGEQVKAGING